MRTFYTGDEHHGHALLQQMRGFASIRDMEEALVANHNGVVQKNDRVIHIGDFAYRGDAKRTRAIFSRLNGSHFLVIGNHDDAETLRLPWAAQPSQMLLLKDGDQRLCLMHYAMRVWPGYHRGVIHLYGHSHNRIPADDRSCDVGVDAWNLMPVALAQIQARLAMSPPHVDAEVGDPEPENDGGFSI
jgi:calcineurin-like phosphoesterase family protein